MDSPSLSYLLAVGSILADGVRRRSEPLEGKISMEKMPESDRRCVMAYAGI